MAATTQGMALPAHVAGNRTVGTAVAGARGPPPPTFAAVASGVADGRVGRTGWVGILTEEERDTWAERRRARAAR